LQSTIFNLKAESEIDEIKRKCARNKILKKKGSGGMSERQTDRHRDTERERETEDPT
jgi:hypothetical protein